MTTPGTAQHGLHSGPVRARSARTPRGRGGWLALVALSGCLVPGIALAEEPTIEEVKYDAAEVPPPGTGGRVMLTGALLMVGWYGVGVGTSYLWQDAPNAHDLRLPLVGPWVSLANVGCGPNEPNCGTGTVVIRTTLGVLSGVGQAGGLLAFVEGIFLKTGSPAPSPNPSQEKRVLRSPTHLVSVLVTRGPLFP